MRTVRSVVQILLALAIVTLAIIVTPISVFSGGAISHPHGTTIEVTAGDNFILKYRLYWNEPGYDGMFDIVINWLNYDNKPEENLTFLSARAYFDNGDNIPIDPPELESGPSGSNTVWILAVRNTSYPNPIDDNFTVDIWMSASGVGNAPHVLTENHPIEGPGGPGGLMAVTVFEATIVDIDGTEAPITIRVVSRPPPPAAPVGGIAFPVDKLALLAPWIALAALIAITSASVAVYWRRR